MLAVGDSIKVEVEGKLYTGRIVGITVKEDPPLYIVEVEGQVLYIGKADIRDET